MPLVPSSLSSLEESSLSEDKQRVMRVGSLLLLLLLLPPPPCRPRAGGVGVLKLPLAMFALRARYVLSCSVWLLKYTALPPFAFTPAPSRTLFAVAPSSRDDVCVHWRMRSITSNVVGGVAVLVDSAAIVRWASGPKSPFSACAVVSSCRLTAWFDVAVAVTAGGGAAPAPAPAPAA